MGNVLSQHGPPRKWQITLHGHFEDVRKATAAVIWNQRETHISHSIDYTGDEAVSTIALRLKENTMYHLVESILDNDHPNIKTTYKRE